MNRPGTILSQMPNNNARVERFVGQRHGGGQRDHVAAEQRQLHARAALRDAVAHGGHAARDLRGGAGDARRGADHFGIRLVRPMRRQHVVVRGDDADVRNDRLLQLRLVFARGGHDVREVGAGQLAARRLDEFSLARALEIFAARRGRAATDAFGDFDDGVVELRLLGRSCATHTSCGRVARSERSRPWAPRCPQDTASPVGASSASSSGCRRSSARPPRPRRAARTASCFP